MATEAMVLDRAAFKAALERVVNDEDFGRRLESSPAATLRSIGLKLPDDVAAELDREPLSRTIEKAFGSGPEHHERVAVVPIPIIVVGVHVGVVVAVATRVKTKAEIDLDETIDNAVEMATPHLTTKD